MGGVWQQCIMGEVWQQCIMRGMWRQCIMGLEPSTSVSLLHKEADLVIRDPSENITGDGGFFFIFPGNFWMSPLFQNSLYIYVFYDCIWAISVCFDYLYFWKSVCSLPGRLSKSGHPLWWMAKSGCSPPISLHLPPPMECSLNGPLILIILYRSCHLQGF